MSSKGVGWAIEQQVRGTDKLVLILMGEAHKIESGLAFPSVQWLVDHTGIDRKTVIRSVDRLEQSQLIVDTGRRVGKTGQIKCFVLNFERLPKQVLLGGKAPNFPVKPPKSGTRNKEDNTTSVAKATSVARVKAKEIDENWWPNNPGEKTALATAQWPQEFLQQEVDKFVAYHRAKHTKSDNFNLQWATWVRSDFAKGSLREWNSERPSNGQTGNAFVRAAASRIARGSAGARASGASGLR